MALADRIPTVERGYIFGSLIKQVWLLGGVALATLGAESVVQGWNEKVELDAQLATLIGTSSTELSAEAAEISENYWSNILTPTIADTTKYGLAAELQDGHIDPLKAILAGLVGGNAMNLWTKAGKVVVNQVNQRLP